MDQGLTADSAAGPHAAVPVRIGVDGYNLAMPRGTGVATYGRVLTEALAGMGHPVDMPVWPAYQPAHDRAAAGSRLL